MTLTTHQKDQLENAALMAFGAGSRVQPDLKHGVRINTPSGQVAAIYWSNNAGSNEVEIAICVIVRPGPFLTRGERQASIT